MASDEAEKRGSFSNISFIEKNFGKKKKSFHKNIRLMLNRELLLKGKALYS